MYAATDLPLTAELLLVAHDPATGRSRVDGQRLRAALAGAAVVELVLQEVLQLEGSGRNTRLRASTGAGQELDPGLRMVLERADGQSPKSAVARVGGTQTFKDRGAVLRTATWQLLEANGVARREQRRVLGLVPVTRWTQPDASQADAVVRRMDRAVRGASERDARTTVLVSVCQAAGLLRRVLPALDRRRVDQWLAEASDDAWAGQAVAKAIADVQAAVVAVIIASSVAATASG
jgi:hypothetical protein